MFDSVLEDFVKEVGLTFVGNLVAECPEDCDKYNRATKTFFKRGKQAYYCADYMDIESLKYIWLVYNELPTGDKFKDKLYAKRAKEFLEKIDNVHSISN